MKKLAKKLAVLVTVLCVALTCALLSACGDDEGDTPPEDDTAVTYTVTVVLPDGSNAGAGVRVGFCTNTCVEAKTDANGVATYKGEKGVNYHIQVNGGFPAGYYAPDYTYANTDADHYTNGWEGTTYTITLTEKPAE